MNLNISQPHLITKTTQGYNEYMESLMSFNTPATLHKGTVRNQEIDTKIRKNYRRVKVVDKDQYYTLLNIHEPNDRIRYLNYKNAWMKQTRVTTMLFYMQPIV